MSQPLKGEKKIAAKNEKVNSYDVAVSWSSSLMQEDSPLRRGSSSAFAYWACDRCSHSTVEFQGESRSLETNFSVITTLKLLEFSILKQTGLEPCKNDGCLSGRPSGTYRSYILLQE